MDTEKQITNTALQELHQKKMEFEAQTKRQFKEFEEANNCFLGIEVINGDFTASPPINPDFRIIAVFDLSCTASEVLPPSKHTPIELVCKPDDENNKYYLSITFSDGTSFKCHEGALKNIVDTYMKNETYTVPIGHDEPSLP